MDENGKVSHGSKQGSATITATMAGGVTQTCLVHNSVTSGASSSSGSGSGASGALSSTGRTSPWRPDRPSR